MGIPELKSKFKCTFEKQGNTADSVALEMAQAVAEYVGAPGGGSVLTQYIHNQGTPSKTWTIVHNLNRSIASVAVTDSAGSVCVGEIQHQDLNTTILRFGAQFSGKAVLI